MVAKFLVFSLVIFNAVDLFCSGQKLQLKACGSSVHLCPGFGRIYLSLLLAPVAKWPLQRPIHHLGNWQHLTIKCLLVFVCVYLLYGVFLCAPMHAHVLIFFSAVVTAWSTSASACTTSVIPLQPICLLAACVLCLLLFTPLHTSSSSSSLFFHLSACICLIVSTSLFTRQESPRQLLSIWSPPPPLSPSLKFRVLFSLPLSALQSLHSFIIMLCPVLTGILLCLCIFRMRLLLLYCSNYVFFKIYFEINLPLWLFLYIFYHTCFKGTI